MQLIETGGPGGAEKVLVELVDSLGSRGIECIVILLKPGWLQNTLVAHGVDCRVIPWRGMLDIRWLVRVSKIISKERVDVIHSHEFFMNCVATLLAMLSRAVNIATVHGKNYYGDRRRRVIAYKAVSILGRMVAVSDDIRTYQSALGIAGERVDVIENGIDTKRFRFSRSLRDETRQELGLDDSNICILVVGNLYPVKGHRYLISALPDIKSRSGSATVLLAGRGKSEQELVSLAKESGVIDAIKFLGFVEDVLPLLCACDIFVLPSLSEGLPLSILEAMACERAVVATKVGGLGEIIVNEKNGLLVESKSPAQLADAINSLIQNPDIRLEMGRAGRQAVESRFSVDEMTRRYLELYGEARTQ